MRDLASAERILIHHKVGLVAEFQDGLRDRRQQVNNRGYLLLLCLLLFVCFFFFLYSFSVVILIVEFLREIHRTFIIVIELLSN